METKKFTTVAQVAKEIGLNNLALKLLDYLDNTTRTWHWITILSWNGPTTRQQSGIM
jgi:hypothetical protein